MELRKIINVFWKWNWLIVLAVTIAAISSFVASKAATPLYRTKTTLMIGRITESPDATGYQLYTSQQLAITYIQLAKREPVLSGAIKSLGLNMEWQALANQVNAEVIPNTQLLEITVIDTDPYRAKVLADAVGEQLVLLSPGTAKQQNSDQNEFTQSQLSDLKDKIKKGQEDIIQLQQELDAANSASQIQTLQTQISVLENKISGWQNTYSTLLISYQGGDVNAVSILEQAQVPTVPFSPNVMNNVLVASLIGLVLALGGAFLIEYMDDTVKNPEEVTKTTGLPTLVQVPDIQGGDEYPTKLVAVNEPLSPIVEAYRILRTNLQFSTLDRPITSLMVTSPSPSEGKSITLANLAVVMAQSGRKVIIVDTDFRRPTQHRIFNLSNRVGLTDLILKKISATAPDLDNSDDPLNEAFDDLGRYIQKTEVPNLSLLSTGQLPPNPAELLGSELMGALIQTLKNQADTLLFDSPPTLVFSDAAVLSTRVDGVIIVNDATKTRRNDSIRAVEELKRVHAHILGIILNRSGRRQDSYYYYYYYSKDGEKKKKRRNRIELQLPKLSGKSNGRKEANQASAQERVPTSANED